MRPASAIGPSETSAAALAKAGYGAIWLGQGPHHGVAILARGTDPIETRRRRVDAEASRLAGEARRWRETYRAAEDALLESARKGARP